MSKYDDLTLSQKMVPFEWKIVSSGNVERYYGLCISYTNKVMRKHISIAGER